MRKNCRIFVLHRNFGRSIRHISYIVRILVAILLGLYVLSMVVFNIPIVKQKLGRLASNVLSEKFGTCVEIKDVNLTLFNRIVLSDVTIFDQAGKLLLKSGNIRAQLNLSELINKNFVVTNLDLFQTTCKLYRKNDESKLNIQFILDSLSSKKPKEDDSDIDFLVRTLIIRDLNVDYDNYSKKTTPNQLNLNHLHVSNIHGNLRINQIASDSLNIRIRGIELKEHSGLEIKKLAMNLVAGPRNLNIQNFSLETPHSNVSFKNLHAVNNQYNKKLDFIHHQFKDLKIEAQVNLRELAFLYPPLKGFDSSPIGFKALVNKDLNGMKMYSQLYTSDKEQFYLETDSKTDLERALNKQFNLSTHILKLHADAEWLEKWVKMFSPQTDVKNLAQSIGEIDHQGRLSVNGQTILYQGNTSCKIGNIEGGASLKQKELKANMKFRDFDLGKLLNNEKLLGKTNAQVSVNGIVSPTMHLTVNSNIEQINIHNYLYHHLSLEGQYSKNEINAKLKVNDEHLQMNLIGAYRPQTQGKSETNGKIDIQTLDLQALHLTDQWRKANLSGIISWNLSELSPTPFGHVAINSLNLTENNEKHGFDSLIIDSRRTHNGIRTIIESDMLEAQVNGNVTLTEWPEYLYSMVKNEMQILPPLFHTPHKKEKYSDFAISFKKTDFLEYALKLPIHFDEMPNLRGYYHTAQKDLTLTAYLPVFHLNGSKYNDGTLYLTNENDSLRILGQITKQFNENDVKFVLNANSFENSVLSQLEWKTLNNNGTTGYIKTKSNFYKDDKGIEHTHIQMYPSTILINDSVWTVNPSSFDFQKDNYFIRDFKVSHNDQYISLNTTPDSIANGKGLIGQLKDIDLGYVFDILNFHPVEFDGKASGTILTNDLSENKDFTANLVVRDFLFNKGEMGTLRLKGAWENEKQQINLDAITQQTEEDSTKIFGNVNVGESTIDLRFHSVRTNMDFLNYYLSGVFDNLHGRTTGNLRLFGPLGAMNLEGGERIEYLSFTPKVLRSTYHITNDSILFSPNRIHFKNVMLKDENSNSGFVNGDIKHNTLEDFGFNLDIKSNGLLVYDWNEKETDVFWGTVYADGNARLWGTTDALHVDADMSPSNHTVFVYDSSNPTGSENKEFIRFVDSQHKNSEEDSTNTEKNKTVNSRKDDETDIYLNFKINANPNLTVQVLTDRKTGDKMSLNGNGPLHINYYNKGKLSMFGTYNVDQGQYRITIKDIIRKTFDMQKGGTIRFNGNPMDGNLNMTGFYSINSVSLGDLNLGNLSKGSTANVDCILYFKGKCGSPEVSFDLDFPNVNDDEKRMVRNMISSQGDMNMQIIYLLSFGRFFTYDYANFNTGSNQNQSTVAMKSLLANTLSEQFNSMLSNAFHVSNWKFGTNIQTGRVGWSDMEVEGLLSGSLLNNRVLINGNFGYREQPTYSSNNFVGDFNIRWLLTKSGIISLKAYSETNDRYFTKTSLTTNGVGILFQRDFNRLTDLFKSDKKK